MYLICGEALFDFFAKSAEGGGGPAIQFDARAGGSLFNVAIGIARLGGKAALLTGISTDMLGETLFNLLETEGVATGHIVRSGRRTTLSLVAEQDGSPAYTFYGVGSADCSLTGADMPDLPQDASITGLHFGSYSIAVPPTADAFLSLAESEHAKGRMISLDPNIRLNVEPDIAIWRQRLDRFLELASLVKVSTEDLGLLYPGEAPEKIAFDWLERGPALIIVTAGSEGARAFAKTGMFSVPAVEVAHFIDAVGAGDSFQAAVLEGLQRKGVNSRTALAGLREAALKPLLERASLAASIACSRRGADLPRLKDLDSSL